MKKIPNEIDFPHWLEHKQNLGDHRPVMRYTYRGFQVFISEGGPFYGGDDPDLKAGWWETSFGLYYRNPKTEKRCVLFQPIMFHINHDPHFTETTRRQARINKARKTAEAHVNDLYKQWLNDSIVVTLNS